MVGLFASLLLIIISTVASAAAELTFEPPAGWRAAGPASSMRVAQFVLPRATPDAQDAEVIVYYFGGSGGTVDANIERWIGQMQQPDGRPSSRVAKRTTRTINGLTVSEVDVSGTYVAEVAPGSSRRHNRPNFRLRAAVVQTPGGPYFVKVTGPARTVAQSEKGYEQFLASLRYR